MLHKYSQQNSVPTWFMQIRPFVERYFHRDICRFECRA